MKVKFYGTRGSIPVCDPNFQEFGGNTTCVMLTFSSGLVAILDAGSGIRNAGSDLLASGHEQFDNMYIGLSHFHWDHLQGFPFFGPAYDPRRHFTISAIGKERLDLDLSGIFETLMQSTYFPVPLDKMGATFSFHQSADDRFISRDIRVKTLKHNHPGDAYSYRIEDKGSVFVYCTDVEHGDTIIDEVVELSEGADLLIHEAQYTPEELVDKKGWGHSSWEQAIEVAKRAGVKQLALTHHDPDHDDDFLRDMEEDCKKEFPNVCVARERQEIVI